jgi:hypothetical protein
MKLTSVLTAAIGLTNRDTVDKHVAIDMALSDRLIPTATTTIDSFNRRNYLQVIHSKFAFQLN